MNEPMTLLCLATYEKGAAFMRQASEMGARVHLVTVEKLRDAPSWPHEALAGFHLLPDEHTLESLVDGVSWLARTERIVRIVALDEFDLEAAAALREHLRLPGLTLTETRWFRDKLAMRECARDGGVPVPAFTGLFHRDDVRAFLDTTPAPWLIKPRTEASAVGIRKVQRADDVWAALDELGDRQSHHLLERFIAGQVYHVDSVVDGGRVLFAEAHRYAAPPFEVMHHGGLFSTRTLDRGSEEDAQIRAANELVVRAMGFRRGVLHTEFIRGADGRFWFLETAARVGGANIVELIEAATGVNLWREWARLEVEAARNGTYEPPVGRADYAGILISLARQEWPDTGAYDDAEIVWRMNKRHHAGLIVASSDPDRVALLLERYMHRFREDFFASLPAPDKPTA